MALRSWVFRKSFENAMDTSDPAKNMELKYAVKLSREIAPANADSGFVNLAVFR